MGNPFQVHYMFFEKFVKNWFIVTVVVILQGNFMSFKYYDIPMFALNDEGEVDGLLEVLTL